MNWMENVHSIKSKVGQCDLPMLETRCSFSFHLQTGQKIEMCVFVWRQNVISSIFEKKNNNRQLTRSLQQTAKNVWNRVRCGRAETCTLRMQLAFEVHVNLYFIWTFHIWFIKQFLTYMRGGQRSEEKRMESKREPKSCAALYIKTNWKKLPFFTTLYGSRISTIMLHANANEKGTSPPQ